MRDLSPFYEILQAYNHYQELQYNYWLHHELFTNLWWGLLALLIIPWIIWWKLVDKTKTGIILAYGIYIMFVVTLLDSFGQIFQLWFYPITLLPWLPFTVGIDWGLLPVIQMLIYQYNLKWKSFLIAETILAAFLSFIGEPIAEWIGIYAVLHWYHHWSFPIYIMIALFGKWLIESLVYHRRKNI